MADFSTSRFSALVAMKRLIAGSPFLAPEFEQKLTAELLLLEGELARVSGEKAEDLDTSKGVSLVMPTELRLHFLQALTELKYRNHDHMSDGSELASRIESIAAQVDDVGDVDALRVVGAVTVCAVLAAELRRAEEHLAESIGSQRIHLVKELVVDQCDKRLSGINKFIEALSQFRVATTTELPKKLQYPTESLGGISPDSYSAAIALEQLTHALGEISVSGSRYFGPDYFDVVRSLCFSNANYRAARATGVPAEVHLGWQQSYLQDHLGAPGSVQSRRV